MAMTAKLLAVCICFAIFVSMCLAGSFPLSGLTDEFGAPLQETLITDFRHQEPSSLRLQHGSFTTTSPYVGWKCPLSNASLSCASTSTFQHLPSSGLTVETWLDASQAVQGSTFWGIPGTHTDKDISTDSCNCKTDVLSVDFHRRAFRVNFIEADSRCDCFYFDDNRPFTEAKMVVVTVHTDDDEDYITLAVNDRWRMVQLTRRLMMSTAPPTAAIVVAPYSNWQGSFYKLAVLTERILRPDIAVMYSTGIEPRRPLFPDQVIDIRTPFEQVLDLTRNSPHPDQYSLRIDDMPDSPCLNLFFKDAANITTSISAEDMPVLVNSTLYLSIQTLAEDCIDYASPLALRATVKLDSAGLETSSTISLSLTGLQVPHVQSSTDTLQSLSETLLSPLLPISNVPVRGITITSIPAAEIGTLFVIKGGRRQQVKSVPVTLQASDTLSFTPLLKVRSASKSSPTSSSGDIFSAHFSYFATSLAQLDSKVVTRRIVIPRNFLTTVVEEIVPNRQGYHHEFVPSSSWLPLGLSLDDYDLVIHSLPSKGELASGDIVLSDNLLPFVAKSGTTLSYSPSGILSGDDFLQFGWNHKYLEFASFELSSLSLKPAQVHAQPVSSTSLTNDTLLMVGEWVKLNYSAKSSTCMGQCKVLLTVEASSELIYLRSNATLVAPDIELITSTRSRVQILVPSTAQAKMSESIEIMGSTSSSAILNIRVDLVDAAAWIGASSQLQEAFSLSVVSPASGQVSGGANSLFASSSVLLGLLIGVPCLVAVIFVFLLCRRRALKKKRERLNARKEAILKKIEEIEAVHRSFQIPLEQIDKDTVSIEYLEARVAQLHMQLQARKLRGKKTTSS